MWNGGDIGGETPQDYLTTTSALVTFHTQGGLTRGNTYTFTVAAVTAVGTGMATSPISLVAS